MEGLWFIALSTATSRTCALACRMNTALSVLSIRHHLLTPLLPLSHTLPFHAMIHKQSFIILIPSSPYWFSAYNAGPRFYACHYFDAQAWVVRRGGIAKKKVVVSIYILFFSHILSNWINVSDAKSSWQTYFFPPSQMGLVIIFHNYRQALPLSTSTSCWEGCTPNNYGRALLLLL